MKLTRSKVHTSMFWVLAVLTIWNLNGVAQMLTGGQQLMSPFIFVSAILCIATCQGGVNQYLEGPGKWFFVFFIGYVLLGIASSFSNDSKQLTSGIVSNSPTPFVLLAAAGGAWTYARNNKMDKLFTGLFFLTLQ